MTKKQLISEICEAAVFAAILFLLCWPVKIDGGSMENTLYPGDRVAVSRIMRFECFLNTGDIIYCKLNDKYVIKRIIAMPNQTVLIEDNRVYVDNVLISEGYTKGKTRETLTLTLSDNEYFVMGDHRSTSIDSRTAGAVTSDAVIGKILFRWYPFTDFKTL